jgi:short-subunit dehydrogenase
MAINATANLRLLQVFDPLLRASPQGRAVFTTCKIADNPKGYWAGYGASKAALRQIVLSYQQEIQHTALSVALLDPGPMATRLRARAFPGEEAGAVPTPQGAVASLLV